MKPNAFSQAFLAAALLLAMLPRPARALALPPADFFQLPWTLGEAWIAMSGFDNGTLRERSSPHNVNQGGAVDFAPHVGMRIGEDTSNAWVVAAAPGRVVETSYCHVKIDHDNGWTTEYYHLGNIQVIKGARVERNQRLAIIDDNANGQICVGNRWPGPHLHFVLRPNMLGATLAGWQINYDSRTNVTTFSKNGQTLGTYQPLLNEMGYGGNATATPAPTSTPVSPSATPPMDTPIATFATPSGTPLPTFATPSGTPLPTFATPTGTPLPTFATPTGTPLPTPTPLSGMYVSIVPAQTSITLNDQTTIGVYLNNLPPGGLSSAEFACLYDPAILEINAAAEAGLFGADAVSVLNAPQQGGQFIFAIAGSLGRRALSDGLVFTFNARGLQVGQSGLQCSARVSDGGGALLPIADAPVTIEVRPAVPQIGVLSGIVFASKPVTVRLYDEQNSLAAEVFADANGAFSVSLPAGSYTVVTASAQSHLSAQGTAVISGGVSSAMPSVALPVGDIDGNNVIDQFDAMTIGMNYNAPAPAAADLNNDGVINLLDLELLAANYRKAGALAWR